MKQNEPLVAIHCLVYNHEPYLRDCFEGFVMQQTNFPFVAIVHDDASTDGSVAIIREYEENYPDIFKPIYETENQWSKKNGTLNSIMNASIDATGAKYVAMCEGDDFWIDPQKLQKQVNFLENNPEYSMCFHSAKIIADGIDKNRCAAKCENIQSKEYSSTDLFSEWIVPTASILYVRRKVSKYLIKYRQWETRDDIILILKCSHTGKVWGMSEKMSIYRMQPNSVTYNSKYRNIEVYKLPNHFKCIFYNFPRVDKKIVNWSISKAYYSKMRIDCKWIDKVCDFFNFIYWDPKYAYDRIINLLKKHLRIHI